MVGRNQRGFARMTMLIGTKSPHSYGKLGQALDNLERDAAICAGRNTGLAAGAGVSMDSAAASVLQTLQELGLTDRGMDLSEVIRRLG